MSLNSHHAKDPVLNVHHRLSLGPESTKKKAFLHHLLFTGEVVIAIKNLTLEV